MLVKIGMLATGSTAAVALYFGGAFDTYPRVVAGSPAAVMSSLADLDIRELPGNPGGTAEAAGGVRPRFQLDRSPGQLEWTVYSGSEVATRMIAKFEPVKDGRQTRIVATVERGDAPDEQISPAFRSRSMTLALFETAINAEIDEMTTPGWGEHCDALRDELMPMDGTGVPQGALNQIRHLNEANAQLKAAGCNIDKAPGANEFRHPTSQMGDPNAATWDEEEQ